MVTPTTTTGLDAPVQVHLNFINRIENSTFRVNFFTPIFFRHDIKLVGFLDCGSVDDDGSHRDYDRFRANTNFR